MASEQLNSRLEEWKVIPDVLDAFRPQVLAEIVYGSTPVITGSALRIEGTQDCPQFRWKDTSGSSSDLYTLALVDPDAPKPQEPSMREYVHWIVANIPASFSAQCQDFRKESTEVLPYKGPAPIAGNHRYIFVLYKQSKRLDSLPSPSERTNFTLRSYAKENGLGTPIFADMFFCEKEEEAGARV
eukprot:TRINITY_DN107_c0_g1_i1.p1 TRINITY_DN107_c0_g1~~TRINITY_DN107_c0_g1_i1.p1  ORF type:complete len:185 (+),score=31.51 TRINITY_DN107_c0_g1_i1:273-827(+)